MVYLLWFLDIRTLILGILVVLFLMWLRYKPRNLPPGPWGLPILGSIPAIVLAVRRGVQPHQIFDEYAQKYGPVFRVRMFTTTVVVLNDFPSIKAAFQNPRLNDRPHMLLTEALKSDGVVMASGEPWVQLRSFCLTVLRSLGVGKSSFEEQIAVEGQALLTEIASYKERPFNPKPQLSNAVLNVICAVVFSQRYDYADREIRELIDGLLSIVKQLGAGGALNFFPGLRHLPYSGMDKVLGNYDKVVQFLTKQIDAHRATLDAENMRDFTDVYLKEIQQNYGSNGTDVGSPLTARSHLSEGNLVGTIGNLLIAGSVTTSATLQWGLLYMMVYQEVQKRVQAEIDTVVGRNRLPRLADKPNLNYTQAVIWEIQRLGSVAPLGVSHAAGADTQLNGMDIPKDALLVANLWAVFRDPKLWPEPGQFKPERFLDCEGKAVKPEELIPFSTGRRSCIGEFLAKMELYIFFSYFMHQFEVRKPDNSTPLSLKGVGGLTYEPMPFEIRVIKRD
ncbi:cytochrome P450 2J6-like [Asterias rubens]|uniref:cytochrome P450 2J6-like n=1 Tax=Asterias rubens TaxID=7604 RepID=UPI001454EAA5|nr:cytochrome P450 2J6-like [Asterias rubens]